MDTLRSEQFEAADVQSRENNDRIPGIDPGDEWSGEEIIDIDLTGRQHLLDTQSPRLFDILEIGEAFGF
jgi:hypothetical protein